MSTFYSKTTKGFYSTETHCAIPSDVVEITRELYETLKGCQGSGFVIETTEDGMPFMQTIAQSQSELDEIEANNKHEILSLKSQVDAGNALEFDMTVEQAQLDALLAA